jgi:peptidoglycan/xylan/chitin deacetylase (PgdA/CDA1 family)
VNPANATDKSISWTSSNENVATVNNGAVTPVAAGTAVITATANDGGKTATCDLTVKAPAPAAKILFTFDDNFRDDVLIAAPILGAKGYSGTAYIVKSNIFEGNWDNMMSTTDVNKLYYDYGWDIGNHSATHESLTSTDETTMINEYITARQWLVSKGWVRAASHVSYPYGETSYSLMDLMNQNNFLTGRTASIGLQPLPVSNFFALKVQEVGGPYTAAKTMTAIDQAVASGSTIILMIHKINNTTYDYTITPSDFQSIVDYVAAYEANGELEVNTITEWYDSVK